jgi:hypothetical protein
MHLVCWRPKPTFWSCIRGRSNLKSTLPTVVRNERGSSGRYASLLFIIFRQTLHIFSTGVLRHQSIQDSMTRPVFPLHRLTRLLVSQAALLVNDSTAARERGMRRAPLLAEGKIIPSVSPRLCLFLIPPSDGTHRRGISDEHGTGRRTDVTLLRENCGLHGFIMLIISITAGCKRCTCIKNERCVSATGAFAEETAVWLCTCVPADMLKRLGIGRTSTFIRINDKAAAQVPLARLDCRGVTHTTCVATRQIALHHSGVRPAGLVRRQGHSLRLRMMPAWPDPVPVAPFPTGLPGACSRRGRGENTGGAPG